MTNFFVCAYVRLFVCVSRPNNFWNDQWIFMKFDSQVMILKVTSMPYILIPYLEPFENGGRSDFWGGCITFTIQHCSTMGYDR
jgi:hypothetical protein